MADKLHIRDCHTQIRCIRRLLLQLQDDLGDLSIDRSLPSEQSSEFATMSETTVDMEHTLNKFQERLAVLSREK
jgi:hypothetical protein